MIRLVALDVDGTLLDSQHLLPHRVAAAVREARDRSIQVSLVTGKLFSSIVPLLTTLNLVGPQITCNGAAVFDAQTMELREQWAMRPAEVNECVRSIHQFAPGLSIAYYTPDAIYTDASPGFLDIILSRYHEPALRHVERIDSTIPPPVKLLLHDTPERLAYLRSCVEPLLGDHIRVVRTSVDFLEFMRLDSSKGHALEQVMKDLDIAASEVMAIGDGENDIPMIEVAGMGIAMGNAVPDLVARAQAQTTTNDADGVAVAFDHLLFSRSHAQGLDIFTK